MICELQDAGLGATAEDVVELRSEYGVPLAIGTVRNHFTALKRQDRIRLSDGRAFTIHDSYRDRESGMAPGTEVETPKGVGVVREIDGDRAAVRVTELMDVIWFPVSGLRVTNGAP